LDKYAVIYTYSQIQFHSVLKQILAWFPNSTLRCVLLMQSPQTVTSNSRPNVSRPKLNQNVTAMQQFPSVLPCLFAKRVFGRRRSEHCLQTFKAGTSFPFSLIFHALKLHVLGLDSLRVLKTNKSFTHNRYPSVCVSDTCIIKRCVEVV
jgi:hypothetical protein